MAQMHGLTSDHKRSHHNPGEPSDIPPDGYAYRTALCGQVRYSKSDGAGNWRFQDGRIMAVDAESSSVTCKTCRSLRLKYGIGPQ